MARRLRRPHDSWRLCSRMIQCVTTWQREAANGHLTLNVPLGGAERLNASTKRCIRKMVGQASLTQDELVTTVTEIESIINSRPLSYISAEDTEEPLTPSHLLIGRGVLGLPDHIGYSCDPRDDDFDIDSTQVTRRMKYLS